MVFLLRSTTHASRTVGQADDRSRAGLKSSDRLSPRGTCLVWQREASVLQLVRSDLDGANVRDLELDARPRHRTTDRPDRRAAPGLRSLSQRPDAEGLGLKSWTVIPSSCDIDVTTPRI